MHTGGPCGLRRVDLCAFEADDYVSQVWDMYSSATLTVDTQASYGTVTGQVTGGLLTFPGVGSFGKPATSDIFSCSAGPFSTAGASGEVLAIIPRLAAPFSRAAASTGQGRCRAAAPRSSR